MAWEKSLEAPAFRRGSNHRGVLEPVGRGAFQALSLLYRRALVPLANGVRVVATGLFVKIPSKVWRNVLSPVLQWTFERVLVPVGKVLQVVLQGLCVRFPYKIYIHLLLQLEEPLDLFANGLMI